jgi:hypothetical protein
LETALTTLFKTGVIGVHDRTCRKGGSLDNRTTQKVVRFLSALSLPGFRDLQPQANTSSTMTKSPSKVFRVSGRVTTFIYLPAISVRGSTRQVAPVDPTLFEAALEQDRKQS